MNTKFTKTQDSVLNGLLRHILTAAGGALVARGSLAESELDLAVGAIITLAGVIWSAIAKHQKMFTELLAALSATSEVWGTKQFWHFFHRKGRFGNKTLVPGGILPKNTLPLVCTCSIL